MEAQARTRTQVTRSRAIPLLTFAAATAAATTLTTTTISASVIHDSTWMTDNQSYDAWIQSHIAALAAGSPANIVDHNAAANFMVDGGTHSITSISGDFLSSAAWGGEGVLVEIFSDVGGSPSNDPTVQFFATEGDGLSIGSFTDTVWGLPGIRFNVDLDGAGVTLDEGSWWLSIVAVHEITPSQPYIWVRQENFQENGELHIRKGSEAHGNDHGGTWGTFDWMPISQQLGLESGDTAFRVTGAAVPTPSALALLALAGLGSQRRRRSQVQWAVCVQSKGRIPHTRCSGNPPVSVSATKVFHH